MVPDRLNAPAPLIRVSGLSKRFPGVQALSDVDFELQDGEVHALIGGNGAGKSTMIRVLGGIEFPDSGTIRLRGEELPTGNIARSLEAGIRIIHQEIALSPNLTVGENIFLGGEPGSAFGLISRREIHRRADELVAELRFPLASRDRVGSLSVGSRQLVEIARALSTRPRVLILDEPTAALDDNETRRLFREIRKLRDRGIGIIYITHRLEEVFEIAERVTVLRDGKSVFTGPVEGLRQEDLVERLVGRSLARRERISRARRDEALLEVRDLTNRQLSRLSLTLSRGEVLGVAGQMGSGRSELARALAGIDPIDDGELLLDGRPLRLRSSRTAIRAGIVLVPEDRRQQGIFPQSDVRFNLSLPDITSWLRFGVTRTGLRNELARRTIGSLAIRARLTGQAVRLLSGGNQQKVVIGKWLGKRRKILILDDPARGVDVAAKEEIFGIVDDLAAAGLGIIFISSEVPEVLRVSDRILVMRRGAIHAVLEARRATEEIVTHLAAGQRPPNGGAAGGPGS